jgi:hypothetical protein
MPNHKSFAYIVANYSKIVDQLVEELCVTSIRASRILGPDQEILDTDHFALETHEEEIAGRMRSFLLKQKTKAA